MEKNEQESLVQEDPTQGAFDDYVNPEGQPTEGDTTQPEVATTEPTDEQIAEWKNAYENRDEWTKKQSVKDEEIAGRRKDVEGMETLKNIYANDPVFRDRMDGLIQDRNAGYKQAQPGSGGEPFDDEISQELMNTPAFQSLMQQIQYQQQTIEQMRGGFSNLQDGVAPMIHDVKANEVAAEFKEQLGIDMPPEMMDDLKGQMRKNPQAQSVPTENIVTMYLGSYIKKHGVPTPTQGEATPAEPTGGGTLSRSGGRTVMSTPKGSVKMSEEAGTVFNWLNGGKASDGSSYIDGEKDYANRYDMSQKKKREKRK